MLDELLIDNCDIEPELVEPEPVDDRDDEPAPKRKPHKPEPKKKRRRRERDPIKPGAHLLFKPQIVELTGTAFPTIWGWMRDDKFPLAIELGPEDGRSSKIAWLAEEIYDWIASRPRRKVGRRPQKNKQAAAAVQPPWPKERGAKRKAARAGR